MRKIHTILAAFVLLSRFTFAADFTVTNLNDAGPGSLRQAILNANANATSDNIQFAIPGNGPHVIRPATPLPVVAYTTHIDGYSQSGSIKPGGTAGVNIPGSTWPAKIMVEINGDGMAGNGLEFAPAAYSSSVKGLSIVGFGTINTQAAIYVQAAGMTIAGNLIGLRPDGTKLANSVGIYGVGCDNVTIGGTTPESRNVISGNTFEGITFMPAGANLDNFSTGHNIQYNFVGTNVTGTAAIGNGLHGIDLDGANSSFILDNVIGGSGEYGIGIDATYSATPPMINNVTVMRNRIGIGMGGQDIGNTVAGIMVINAHDITIGSSVTNHNIIAYNGTGVVVKDYPEGTSTHSYNVQITYNRIYNNDGLGIDLMKAGDPLNTSTVNDYETGTPKHDADLGPNGLQNYPDIDSAYVKNGELIIKGKLRTDIPNSTYNVVFFNNPQEVLDYNTYGYENYIRIGLIAVTTDANGEATFTAVYPYTTEYGKGQANFGDHIVAFARSATENTSEFSPAFQVTAYSDKVCYSTSSNQVTYSIAAVPGATGYTWTVKNASNVEIKTGTGTISSDGKTVSWTVDWQNEALGTYTVCVTASNTCGTSYSSCLPVEVTNCTTDLVITKTANPNPVVKSGTLTYLITVTNNGAIPALNVVVTDNIPTTLTVTGTTPSQGTWSAPTWTVGTLAAGASATLQIVTTVGPSASNPTANTATVTSSTPDNNSANNNATVSVEVSNRLAISCPPPVTKSCASDVPAHATDYASFIALGGTVSGGNPLNGTPPYTVSWISDVKSNQTCLNNYIITRTYSATDKNNTELCSQVITVNDQTPPVITCPPVPAVHYKCASDVPQPATNYTEFINQGGTATDGCGGVVIVLHVSDVITNQTCTNRFTLTRTYRAIDECGNASICQQIITVNDDVAPTFTVPADITISCDISDGPDITGVPTNLLDGCVGTTPIYTYTDAWDANGEQCNGTGVILRTWTVTDQCGNSSTAVQKITIEDKTAPVIACIGNQTRRSNIGGNVYTYTAVGTEFDPTTATDNCGVPSVSYTLSGATKGSGFNTLAGTLFITGVTTVTWKVIDACGHTAACSFTVTVNDPPLAVNDVNTTFVNMPVSGNVLTNDSDPDKNTLTATAETNKSTSGGGTVTINTDGSYTYTPAAGFKGEDTFTYTVCDTYNTCSTATVTIEVMPFPVYGNQPPVAVNDSYEGTIYKKVTGTLLANDFDFEKNPLTVTSAQVATNNDGQIDDPVTFGTPVTVYGVDESGAIAQAGTLTLNSNGNFTFEPFGTFTGQVNATYAITDGKGGTDEAVLNIYISRPTANTINALNDVFVTIIDTDLTGNVMGNDYDRQGDELRVTGAKYDSNGDGIPETAFSLNSTAIQVGGVNNSGSAVTNAGTLIQNADGTFTFNPESTFTGDVTYTYTLCDDGTPAPVCEDATVTITLRPAPTDGNDLPLAINDVYLLAARTTLSGNVITNDIDVDMNGLTVIENSEGKYSDGNGTTAQLPIGGDPVPVWGINYSQQNVEAGTLTQRADGTFTFVPNAEFTGTVVYTYVIKDGDGSTDVATVTIDVVSGNSTIATDDAYMGVTNQPITGNLTLNDYDPQGNTQGTPEVVSGSGPSHGTVSIAEDGTFTYTPNPGYYGTDQFIYQVCDDAVTNACDKATVYLNIAPKNLWKGSSTSSDWNTAANWVTNRVPAQYENIEFATEANNPTVDGVTASGPAVNDLVVPAGADKIIGSLINASSKNLIIPPGGTATTGTSLTVTGVVAITDPTTGLPSTDPSKIQIKAAEGKPNGTFLISCEEQSTSGSPDVYVTVDLFAKGYKDNENSWTDNIVGSPTNGTTFKATYHWQYFGVPVETIKANPTFYGSYLRKYHEEWNKTVDPSKESTYYAKWENLVNNSDLVAFEGYGITQDFKTIYSIPGKLQYCEKEITLTRSAPLVHESNDDTNINNRRYGLGQNIFGNSYTASIDIDKLNFPDKVENTVYLYNTGRFTDWAKTETNNGLNDGTTLTAGMYTSIPQYASSAIYDGRIPSLNGFLLIHKGYTPYYESPSDLPVTMKLPYANNLVANTRPQTAPRKPLSYLRVGLASKSTRDNLWLFSQPGTTDKLDDGWDGRKFFGTPTAFIYTENADGPMQVSANETIDGSVLSFYANSDTEYVLTLAKSNLEDYTDLNLIDLLARTVTPLSSDTTRYRFTANSKGSTIKRFIIANSANINLNSDKFSLLHGYVKDNSRLIITNFTTQEGIANLFDITGKRFINRKMPVSVSEIPVTLEPGVYILDLQADGKHESIKLIIK